MVAAVSATGQLLVRGLSSSSGVSQITGTSGNTLYGPISCIEILGNTNALSNASMRKALGKYNIVQPIASLLTTPPGTTTAAVFSDINAQAALVSNTYSTVGQYFMEEDFYQNTGVTGFNNHALFALMTLYPEWWLSSTWPAITNVNGDPNMWVTLSTSDCPRYTISSVGSITGPGSVDFNEACAWLEWQQTVNGNCHALNASDPALVANPYMGFMMHDNQFQVPYYGGKWLAPSGDTTTYPGNDIPATNAPVMTPLAQGHQRMVNKGKALAPNIKQMGNCDHYNHGATVAHGGAAFYDPAVQGLYDIVYCEGPFNSFAENGGGCSTFYSTSNVSTLVQAMLDYEILCDRTKRGNCVAIFGEGPGYNATTFQAIPWPTLQSSFAAADWQAWRYMHVFAMLMNNADFGGTAWGAGFNLATVSGEVAYADEFDAGNTRGVNWWGPRLTARNMVPWSLYPAAGGRTYGLWRGDYTNAVGILNPKGNGPQTFQPGFAGHFLPTTTRAFGNATTGWAMGDPAYNSGLAFTATTNITLQDRDAIVLLRS